MATNGRRWTLRNLRSSLPREKVRADAYWTRWILRPLSYPVSLLFLRWGWSANAVSYGSAGVAILGGLLLSLPYLQLQVTGAILLNLFAVLDCVDGNIARVTGTEGPWGAWADALGGYVAYAAALLGAGMAAEITAVLVPTPLFLLPEQVWPRGGWVLLGGVAASANLLMRLTYQQYRTLRLEKGTAQPDGKEAGPSPEITLEKRISENLGVTGLLMPAILAGILTDTICYVVLFYTLLYGGGAGVSILRLAKKMKDWKSSP